MSRDLAALYRLHGPELEAYLVRETRCRETAGDLLHEVFLRLAQAPYGEKVEAVRPYLFRIARNLVVDRARQAARRRTDVTDDSALSDIADPAPSVERVVGERLTVERLNAVMAELPDLTQSIFRLNRLEGLTHKAVAKRLGVSESTVQKHLSAALQHAMRRLDID